MLKRILIAAGSLLVIAGLAGAFYKLVYVKSPRFNKAGLKVETFYPGAKVYLDGNLSGETPFTTQNLKPGIVTLAVDGKHGRFEDKITLGKDTFSLVSLKVAPVSDFTASQVLWLEKQAGGQSLSVLSNVLGVRVAVDGEDKGLAPLTVESIAAGDHQVVLSRQGFATVTAAVNVLAGHKVNFKVSLSPIIMPQETANIAYEASELVSVQNFTLPNIPSFLLANPQSWARGLAFAKETDPESKLQFDYLLDYSGQIYGNQGEALDDFSSLNLEEGVRFGYLGDSDKNELAAPAKGALDKFVAQAFGGIGPQVEIIETGTGFLRVRGTPSLSGAELGQVDVGEKFRVLEEQGGWVKIEYAPGKEGWVLGDYVKEITNDELKITN